MSQTASKAVKQADKTASAGTTKAPAVKKKIVKKQNGKIQFVSAPVNAFLWIVSAILICGAIFGNYYYSNYMVVDETTLQRLGRVLLVIVTIVAGLAILLLTNRGHDLLKFGSESYTELLKVVWPTRQEAVQTTVIVFIAVCVVSLFLYLCDVVFLEIVRMVTL
ncbi:MAG: preprotein translocase subunit SecE [Succinatimonas hippei]|nr:preprotein translocase subunit SecE [Succinatimonas hippei]